MSELDDLYQEVILDHYKRPRNFGVIDAPDRRAEGDNPLCGDRFILTLKMRGDVIEEVRFKGAGCAISTASASIMTESVKGRPRAEAEALFDKFHTMVTSGGAAEDLGKLAAFAGVGEFPIRVKCATLAWHTLKAALEGTQDTVSTE
ncbi:MAG: SUF system NifU family Fe-S cluster assembly protein [Planctomycetes bacterium]|nr:SUF system NifU family Fe-S cluster assembly protein [Planctomycetota bacterium]